MTESEARQYIQRAIDAIVQGTVAVSYLLRVREDDLHRQLRDPTISEADRQILASDLMWVTQTRRLLDERFGEMRTGAPAGSEPSVPPE